MRRLLKITSCSFLMLCLLPAPLSAMRDVGATEIVFPNGEVRYRDWMLPLNVQAQAVVKNFGDSTVSFTVHLRIDTASVGTSEVTDLPPQESALVQFPVTLPETGAHSISCSTALAGDVQPANDRIVDSFETFWSGLYVTFFTPHGTVRVGDTIRALAMVTNLGFRSEEAVILLTISRLTDSMVVYQGVESAYVAPLEMLDFAFSSRWVADSVGVYECLQTIGRMPPPLLDTLSWLITVALSGVSERAATAPERERLTLVAANPTTDDVRVSLCLPEDQAVRLLVCDASGRCVADLARGSLPHGVHLYSWSATRFPPGVYFVRLETPNYAEVRKLILSE